MVVVLERHCGESPRNLLNFSLC